MKHHLAGIAPGLLLFVSLVNADLLSERKSEMEQPIPPLGVRSYVDTFKAHKRALVVVSGKGRTCLGLYVFDEHGNCVAKDDVTSPKTCDDLAADWIPIATSRYDVEICNAGLDLNSYEIAIR